ncbi:MAG TPA: hypothetical protein VFV94_16430 [Polyangiaceae bacterium]|nr:hypothetical protein [Polyangiaceae bacterium]
MVARVRLASSVLFAIGAAMATLGAGCGGESSRGVATEKSGGMGGAIRGAGAGGSGAGTVGMTITEGEGGFVGATDAGPEGIPLGGPECETRRAADCEGIDRSDFYSGHGVFDASPELAACSAYVSFDGCGKLIYAFDDEGCALFVDPGPSGWKQSEHLSLLRDCLSRAFTEARFSCLASRTFAFYESCYIR